MKDIKTFEQFVNTTAINEGNGQTIKEFGDLLALLLDRENGLSIEKAINALPPAKARTLEKQISSLYKKLFNLSNEGFGMDESVVNEGGHDQAYNIKMLKHIKFMLHSWEFVDKDFQGGAQFRIAFTDKVKRKDIDKAIYDFVRKDKNADGPIGDMDIEWDADEFSSNILRIKNGNYPGLTYIFAALDKYYGKFGSSMGWD